MSSPPLSDPRDLPPGLVAVPSLAWMWTQTAESLIVLRGALPPKSSMLLFRGLSSPAASRNYLIESFLSVPHFEWILFLDGDMTPEAHTVTQLLSHDVDAVSAMCFHRFPPYLPAWSAPGATFDVNRGGLCEVDAVIVIAVSYNGAVVTT